MGYCKQTIKMKKHCCITIAHDDIATLLMCGMALLQCWCVNMVL